MIINLSFNKILPLLALNLLLLKYSYGMFPPHIYPHHQQHQQNPNDLVDKLELIENTEEEFSQMLEKVDKFKDKYIEINPKLILGNALRPFTQKLPREAIVYKELFDKLKLFWFDKVEDDLNVENKNAEVPLISLETSHNEERNNFAKEWEDDTLKALNDDLQVNQPTQQPTQIISPQYTQHGQRNIDVHDKLGLKKVEDLPLQENLLYLRKTVNNVLKQIFTEFVVGLEYNSFKKMGEEFEKTEELIKEYMLDRYKNLYDQKDKIAHLHKLYIEIIEKNAKLKIKNYWTKHVLDFKNKGFGLVVGKLKTIELEDINELIKNNYAGLDEELTPSRILDDKVSKLENNNDIRNIVLKDFWKQNKKKVAIFHLEGGEKEEMKMNQQEIEIFEKHQKGEIKLEKEQKDRLDDIKDRFETWIVAEFSLKKALKDVAKFFEKEEVYMQHFKADHLMSKEIQYKSFFNNLSSLADNIEENIALPKKWLEDEETFYSTKHEDSRDKTNDNFLEKLSVLIRINAGQVLLAYTRMKQVFKAFNVDDFDQQKARQLAGIFEGKIKSEADQAVLENIHERILKFYEKHL
uniref:Uncharacterized protein n=1 Tax=Meloidogyne javanica TaxID=6303 RepID=A0A915LEQ1_MELJA